MSYRGAHDRLRDLEPVILASDLSSRFGWSAQVTAVYVNRWKRQGLIRPLGGRSGVYFNLVADPDWERHLDGAVGLAMPGAVEIGPAILHAEGVTTQRSYTRDLAMPYGAQAYSLDGFHCHRRGRRWYVIMHPYFVEQAPDHAIGRLPRLSAPAALADMLTHDDLWLPDPDDLDLDELDDADIEALADLIERLDPNLQWDPDRSPEENYERLYLAVRGDTPGDAPGWG